MRLLLFTCLVFISQISVAGTQSDFETYMQQQNQGSAAAKDEFETYKQKLLTAFEQYKKQTGKVWGNSNNVTPQANNWVSFHGDLGHRSVVDFEQGIINVEIAIPTQQNVSADEARRQLEATIIKTLNQGADHRSMIEIAKQPVAISSGPAILNNLIGDAQGNTVNQQNYSDLAAQDAASATSTKIRGNDGVDRIVYHTQLKMVPDHIRKRAVVFQSDVNAQSQRQNLPPALVFAVMETESYFNPVAKSSAPAFGLMQLVPTSGAREAYRYVYNQDKVVSDTYLYDPKNNIELGSAYLNRLYYVQLSGIENPQSRMWASIAAYNTGPSNVLRAFAGKYYKTQHGSYDKWRQLAYNKINGLTPDQMYDHLRGNLPYPETREYVKKVGERIGKYQS
jgi:membrane-bound lytic murein transglycosylase C